MVEGELITAVETALRSEIITIEDDRNEIYRFSHSLIREVLYSQPLSRRRRQIHNQIAEQFKRRQPKNIYATAYHFYEAENWEQAADFCLKAGEQTASRFASYSALQWYQKALDAAERSEKEFDLKNLSLLYERLGRTHLALANHEGAEAVYLRMRDVAQRNRDLIMEGYALVNLANMYMKNYEFNLAEKAAEDALKIGDQANDLHLLTSIKACLGSIMIGRGRLNQSTFYFDQVMDQAELLNDSVALIDALRLTAYQAIWVNQYEKAEMNARRALELSQKNRDPLTVVGAYQNLAFVQIETGRYLEAHQNIQDTLSAIENSGSQHHQEPRLLNLMGYLYLELGAPEEALIWDQRALDAIRDTYPYNLEMRRYSLLNKATDFLHLGKLDEAMNTVNQFKAIQEGAEFVRFRYFNRYQLLMCEYNLKQEKFDKAIEWAREAHSLAQSKNVHKNIARSLWFEGQALAGLMRFVEARKQLQKAVSIADNIQHGSLRWKIRLSLTKILLVMNESADDVIMQTQDFVNQTIQSLSGSPLQGLFLASDWAKQIKELESKPVLKKQTYPAGLTQREG